MILEFLNKNDAEIALNIINQELINYLISENYTIINNQVIGRSVNGIERPESARTISWSNINETDSGKFYISSIRGTRYEYLLSKIKDQVNFIEKIID